MRYCPDCGTGHECEGQAGTGPAPEVEIARINADRDKYVARVSARMNREELETAEDIAETEAEASIIGDVASAQIIASEPAGETAEATGEPIVIEAPAAETEPEPSTEEPPVIESAPPKESKRGGYWSGYK